MLHFPGAFTYVVLKLWSASNTKKDNHAEKSAPIVLDYIHLLAKCWAVKFGDVPLLRQHIKEDLKFSADHQTELSHWYFYIGNEKSTPLPWNKSAKPCMCRNSTPKREGCDVFVPAYLFNLLTEDQGFCSSAALLLLKFVLPTRPVGWSVRALSDTSKPSPACYMSAVSEELQSLHFPLAALPQHAWQVMLAHCRALLLEVCTARTAVDEGIQSTPRPQPSSLPEVLWHGYQSKLAVGLKQ